MWLSSLELCCNRSLRCHCFWSQQAAVFRAPCTPPAQHQMVNIEELVETKNRAKATSALDLTLPGGHRHGSKWSIKLLHKCWMCNWATVGEQMPPSGQKINFCMFVDKRDNRGVGYTGLKRANVQAKFLPDICARKKVKIRQLRHNLLFKSLESWIFIEVLGEFVRTWQVLLFRATLLLKVKKIALLRNSSISHETGLM